MARIVEDDIKDNLQKIAVDNNVDILYACESGSRSWGFESPNSDYDVRFLYRHKPEWYTSLRKHRRDVIEVNTKGAKGEELDISGWDIRKAFGLLMKSNPALFEWLRSPIIYITHPDAHPITEAMLSGLCYDAKRAAYHYYHMARGNYREYLKKDTVPLKKYLYVIRPLLANKHIQQGHGFPPVLFEELFKHQQEQGLDKEVVEAIERLLKAKKAGLETKTGPKSSVLNAFIEHELEYSNPDDLKIEIDHFDFMDRLDGAYREIVGI